MSGIEVACAAVTAVVEFVVAESCSGICRIVKYSKSLEEFYHKLDSDLQSLDALKSDNETKVQRRQEKGTTHAYKLWTQRVSKIVEEVKKLKAEYDREKLPKWRILRRSRLSEEIQNRRDEVQELIKNGGLKDFLADKLPESVVKELDVPQIGQYQTLHNALESILCLLKSVKIKAIGVCGIKGVGKTTLMQNLNNNEAVATMFDIVIFVRVSADQTNHELQQKIAKRLKVDAKISDYGELAIEIHKHMENKKYMLILDGVVDNINLTGLGIPNNNKGSKVVIATQFPRVCKSNGVERIITVPRLSANEAWTMFQGIVRTVNSEIDNSRDFRATAELVCNRCSCLPLLIHKIASFFKLKEKAASWRAGLRKLDGKLWPELEIEGLKELYKVLTFYYDDIKDENKRTCFLYTSLYPAYSKVYVDYLVECWIAQGFLGNVQGSTGYQDAHDEGYSVLEDLLSVSLLEKGEQMIYVRMNDCMREIALHILSTYVQTTQKSGETTNSETWQNARWVSMIDSNVHVLPTNPICNKVLALLLQKNPKLAKIPETFFQNMSSLRVLDLYHTGIGELPSSLSNLTSVKALYLNDCKHLTDMPPQIGSLQLLEIFDVRGTKVSFIPSHIGCLVNLRCLRISYIKSDSQSGNQDIYTENDVISKLHKLEELMIEVISYEQWRKDAESVLNQVASLQNLSTFICSFPSAIILKNFIASSRSWRAENQVRSFQFFIGRKNSKSKPPQILAAFEHRVANYLMYCNGQSQDDLAVSEALPRTDAFELISHNDITKLSQFGTENLNRIRGFLIERCNQISTIVTGDDNGTRNGGILTNLEQFYLVNLLNLNCLFRGPFHPGSLSKLHTLVVQDCSSLKSIFSNGAIQHFSELRKLRIENCATFEELIMVTEDMERDGNMLPKLELLKLNNLPNLRIICTDQKLAWSSLELLEIYDCPQLKTFPFGKDKAANLRSIKGEKQWWDRLEWTDNEVREKFQHMLEA